MQQQKLFIISGPSGVGEDSIITGLRDRFDVQVAVTTTTRNPRPGESEGHPYYFISTEEFQKMIEEDCFAEWAQQYNNNYYGITKEELARVQDGDGIGLWKIDYQGVEQAKKLFPDIVAIFLMAESLDVLEERIRRRSNVTEDYIRERMAYTKKWLNHADLYDYTIINKEGHLADAIDDVAKIIAYHAGIETTPQHTKLL